MFFENANNITINGQEVQSIRISDEEVYKKSRYIYENPNQLTSFLNLDIPINTNHFIIEYDLYHYAGGSSYGSVGLKTDEFGDVRVVIGFYGNYVENGVKSGNTKLISGENYPKSINNYHIKFEYNNGELSYYNGIGTYTLTYLLSNIRFVGCTIVDCKISNLVIYEVKD